MPLVSSHFDQPLMEDLRLWIEAAPVMVTKLAMNGTYPVTLYGVVQKQVIGTGTQFVIFEYSWCNFGAEDDDQPQVWGIFNPLRDDRGTFLGNPQTKLQAGIIVGDIAKAKKTKQ